MIYEADPEMLERIDKARERVNALIEQVEALLVEAKEISNGISYQWALYTHELDEAERAPKQTKKKRKVKLRQS